MKVRLSIICILFSLSCFSQDTICLKRSQYIEIYKGLKTWEAKYRDAYDTAERLNVIIQQQNDTIQAKMYRLEETNYELDHLNYQYQNKKSLWWLWASLGLLTGLIIK